MNCKEFEQSLSLYLYDELAVELRLACEAHVAVCVRCRESLEKAQGLQRLLRGRPVVEPSADLLVECRQALDEELDREQVGRGGLVRWWLNISPAASISWAVAILCLMALGFGLGWSLRPRAGKLFLPTELATPGPFTGADLANLRISTISRVAPDPVTGDVRITLDAERRVTLEGSLDDARIRAVLIYAVKNYDNAGIRRDTLDALQARSDNPAVRQALLYAMRKDPNVGVRLEALGAVHRMDWTPEVRQALLETLRHDLNPGVRVGVLELLVKHADEETLPVLAQLAASDRNLYVRLKCANAVRGLKRDDF